MCIRPEDLAIGQITVSPTAVNKTNIVTQLSLLKNFFPQNKDQPLQSAIYPYKVRVTACISIHLSNSRIGSG